MEFLEPFFNGQYMPHGHCYLWHPGILWTNVISDLVIALTYFSIPIALIYIVNARKDIQFRGIFFLFSGFILFCGITHLFSIYTIWHGVYGVHGVIKAMTAVISLLTAVVLFKSIESVKKIPSVEDLQNAVFKASNEKMKRNELEIKRKADALFKITTELLPTGLLVVDQNKKIILANKALADMFEYSSDELKNESLNKLLIDSVSPIHDSLVDSFLESAQKDHARAFGRFVNGKTKTGKVISIQISLSNHDVQGEKLAFASIYNESQMMENKSLESMSCNRIKRAISATKMGIWEWDLKTNDVWYSPKLLTLIGQAEDSPPRLELWRSHIHPDDIELIDSRLKAHFEKKQKYDVIYRGVTESGKFEWMRACGDTIFDNDDKPILMSGTLTNINEIKLLEKKLENKTRFLNEVLERSLTGLYIFNLDTMNITFVNHEYTRLTGYSKADLVKIQGSDGLMTLFHPDDRLLVELHIKEVFHNKMDTGVTTEYRFKHQQGHWIWCYSRDSIYSFDENGKPKEMLGAFFDITALKEREQEIKTLAVNFLTTFEQAAVGIAHATLEGKFIKVNSKLCEILGYTKGELLELSYSDITHERDMTESWNQHKLLAAGAIKHYIAEQRFITKSRGYIWARLTVALVNNPRSDDSHFISVIEDISHKKKIELQLAESNSALERFAYSASHDLQEPLRKISAFAGSLQSSLAPQLVDNADARFQLDRISDAAQRMSEMINQLLELSRYSRNNAKKSNFRLAEIVAQVSDDLSTIIEQNQVTINVINDGNIFVESSSFQQVLRNLILNSINYKDRNRQLVVNFNLSIEPSSTRISVADNGIGFDSENNKKIFEPFRRLVGKESPGYGMGLAICRQIILAHDGKIWAKGVKDKGVEIIIEIPKD
ncbi:PAS domain S-box protein [Aliikangiella maris]|uniref:PAS domain S-box protein n=3 Tax=Aliikangiella maris TaxID=3162458 RepID=A0ABV3MR13_9GAMM